MNNTIDETNFVGNIKQFVILNGVLAPLYLLFLLLPSLFLNGTIIMLFVKKKELRSPLNLLAGNQCCYGILSNLLNGFLAIVVYPISLSYLSALKARYQLELNAEMGNFKASYFYLAEGWMSHHGI